jgi:hypothetical protein
MNGGENERVQGEVVEGGGRVERLLQQPQRGDDRLDWVWLGWAGTGSWKRDPPGQPSPVAGGAEGYSRDWNRLDQSIKRATNRMRWDGMLARVRWQQAAG